MISDDVVRKMERIARACGAPATRDELRKDLLSAGATIEQAEEYLRRNEAHRNDH